MNDPASAATRETLRRMGHGIDPKPARQGDAHSIGLDPNGQGYLGVADPRRAEGRPAIRDAGP